MADSKQSSPMVFTTKNRRPLTCCDRDCATVNHCGGVGGVQCVRCGDYFCPNLGGDTEENICENCLDE